MLLVRPSKCLIALVGVSPSEPARCPLWGESGQGWDLLPRGSFGDRGAMGGSVGLSTPASGRGWAGLSQGQEISISFSFFFSFFKFPLNFWCGVGGCKYTLRPCARMQLLEPFVRAVSDVAAGFHGLLMTGELRVWKGWAGLGGHAVKHLWALSSCGSRTHSPHRPPGTQTHHQPRSSLKPHPQICSVTHRHGFRLDEALSNPV